MTLSDFVPKEYPSFPKSPPALAPRCFVRGCACAPTKKLVLEELPPAYNYDVCSGHYGSWMTSKFRYAAKNAPPNPARTLWLWTKLLEDWRLTEERVALSAAERVIAGPLPLP
jgi:hypothetical protein